MTPPKNMTEYARQAGKTWTFKSKNRTTKSCPKMKIPRANQRSKRFGIAEKVKPKMAMKNKATENWRKVHLEANRSPRQCDCDLLVQLACEGWWYFGGFDIFLFLPHSRGIFFSVSDHNLRNLCMQPMSVKITGNLRCDCRRCSP